MLVAKMLFLSKRARPEISTANSFLCTRVTRATEVAIFLGDALVYTASRKQKCVTKSPMESELVALTDYIGLVELFAEFAAFITDSPVQIPVIYQDSTSIIALVTKGGGIVRTKHLHVRMNLCKGGLGLNKFRIKHVLTDRMIADGFTKALGNTDFKIFMKYILGDVVK